MRSILLISSVVASLSMFSPARAQYVMDWNAGNALIMSSIQNDSLNRERARADRARQPSRQKGQHSSVVPATRSITDRTFDAAIAALAPEFQRRTTAYGKRQAAQWLNSAARDLGGQMGALAPEYRRRLRINGRSSADQWYIDRARLAGQQYAQNGESR